MTDMGGILQVLGQLLGVISNLNGLSLIAHLFNVVMQAMVPLLPALGQITEMIGTTLLTAITQLSPILASLGLILKPILELVAGALAAVMPLIAQLLGAVLQLVGAALAQLVPVLTPIIQALTSSLVPILAALIPIVMEVIDAVLKLALAFIAQVLPALMPLIPVIVEVVQQLAAELVPAFKALATWVHDNMPLIMSIVKIAMDTIVAVIKVVVAIIKGMMDIIIGIQKGDWPRVWKAIGDIVNAAVQFVVGLIKTWLIDKATGFLIDMGRNIGAWFKSAWDGASLAVRNGIANVIAWVAGIAGRIGSAMGNLYYTLVRQGNAIMQGFFDGLISVWNHITDFVGGIANWIASHKGPISYDRTLLIPHGQAIMGGLNDGLQGGFGDVQTFIGGVADQIAAGFTDKHDALTTAAQSMVGVVTAEFSSSKMFLAGKDAASGLIGGAGKREGQPERKHRLRHGVHEDQRRGAGPERDRRVRPGDVHHHEQRRGHHRPRRHLRAHARQGPDGCGIPVH